MLNPPRLEYYGDIEKASTLKGAALAFYQFVCSSMGKVQSIQREKRDGDTSAMQVTVWTSAYGTKHGVVKIYVAEVSSDGEAVLFPTSFNDTDLGTQIYKAPYPAKKQGDLILANDNPNYLVLPTPTYSARTNYWVNDKENATVSWDYVEYLNESLPIGHANRKRKYGKIAISGIETGIAWGKFLEPLVCALIDKDADGLPVKRIVIIYVDRVNYAGSGNNRWIAVYDYQFDTAAPEIYLSEITKIDFTALGYGTNTLIGFFGDAKRLAIRSTVERNYQGTNWQTVDPDNQYDVNIPVNTINVIDFNGGFSAIVNDDIVYEELPLVSDVHNYRKDGGTLSLVVPIERVSCDFIDVRGDYISFGAEKVVSEITFSTSGNHAGRQGENYSPYQSENTTSENYLIAWSKGGGLKRTLLALSILSTETTTSATATGYISNSQTSSEYTSIHLYLKKQNECIYSNTLLLVTSSGETGTLPNGSYGQISEQSSSTSSKTINSKNAGELYSTTLSLGSGSTVDDYSYTKDKLVASISAFEYDSQNNETNKSFTLIADFKDKKRKILTRPTSCISLTKLPKI